VHSGRTTRPRRAVVAISTAAATALGGLVMVPGIGYADPNRIDEVRAQVEDLHHEAEQATERYNQQIDRLDEVQRRLARAQANVTRQQERVDEVTSSMGGYAAATYRTGGVDPTMQVLLADDPDEFLAQASVVDAYTAQQLDQLTEVAAERQALEEQKLLADEELGRLKAVEAALESERAAITARLDEAQGLLDSLKAEERARLEAERQAEIRAAEEARQAAASRTSRDSSRAPAETPIPDVPASGRGKIAVDFALAQLGDPYSWGATGPDAWDCSGLTLKAWAQAGVSLPRSSSAQAGAGAKVSRSNLQPGDLVFYYSPISHVAIYIGNDQIVHATRPGRPVSIASVSSMPYSGAVRPG
jgi:peptidoglycan DL-endopeptidase CwlO